MLVARCSQYFEPSVCESRLDAGHWMLHQFLDYTEIKLIKTVQYVLYELTGLFSMFRMTVFLMASIIIIANMD